jgi:CheY-like chemotaxis protein
MIRTVASAARSGDTPNMRVLVVDDEVNLRFAIERRLRRAGMEAASASTVRQAVERLRADAYDVVLCDLHMPGGDGTKLLQWLGSYSPSTRVIIVSAFVTPEIRAEYESGAGLYIVEKPVDLDVLVDMLEDIGPRAGFYGNAIEVELFDYVQMIALSGRDKIIEVNTPRGTGMVWFEHGDIVHAEFDDLRGEPAFYELIAASRGTFKELFFRPSAVRTVTCSSTHLLMEAARKFDEDAREHVRRHAIPGKVDDETSFAGLDGEDQAGPARASAAPEAPVDDEFRPEDALIDDDFVLPADDDETPTAPLIAPHVDAHSSVEIPIDGWDDVVADHEPLVASPAEASGVRPRTPSGPSPSEIGTSGSHWGQHAIVNDQRARAEVIQRLRAIEGVSGVAIISSTGNVLADDMPDSNALVTLAGFYMRGAARMARALGVNVFDGVIARATSGQQMVMVSMGPTSAVLSVEIGSDLERVRSAVMEAG